MLIKTAFSILHHEKWKYAGVVCGIAMALFLVLLQSGFYFGFRRDITVIQDSFDADLWIIPRNLLSFDFMLPFDDLVRWQAAADPDVQCSTGVISEWIRGRSRITGGTESLQIVGVDFTSGVKFFLGREGEASPYADPALNSFPSGEDISSALCVPGNVLIDQKDFARLGTSQSGQIGFEIAGRNANVVGSLRNKKLFTTAIIVVTDLDNARRFLSFPSNRISFVAIKCRPGADIRAVQDRLRNRVFEQEVVTSRELHTLTQRYWLRLTGMGPVLLIGAALAALVGFITVFLTFSNLVHEKVPVYAALKALGASTRELTVLVIVQIAVVFGLGSTLAVGGVVLALAALSSTSISVVITPMMWCSGIGFMGLCSAVAGMRVVFTLSSIEPATAFRT